ncbi:hypothetical protein AAY473_027278, partial [Plecturocebus cupreus]
MSNTFRVNHEEMKLRRPRPKGNRLQHQLADFGAAILPRDHIWKLLVRETHSVIQAGRSAVVQPWLIATSTSGVPVKLPPWPPEYLGLQKRFYYVGQAGLELLTSGDPPTLAYQ